MAQPSQSCAHILDPWSPGRRMNTHFTRNQHVCHTLRCFPTASFLFQPVHAWQDPVLCCLFGSGQTVGRLPCKGVSGPGANLFYPCGKRTNYDEKSYIRHASRCLSNVFLRFLRINKALMRIVRLGQSRSVWIKPVSLCRVKSHDQSGHFHWRHERNF